MKKILTTLITLVILMTNNIFSQTSNELLEQKDKLELRKKNLLNEISDIDKEIDLLASEITFTSLKENSIKTTIRRSCKFYENPSEFTNIIDNPKIKTDILIIEYYEYGTYYKAIYNGKIGYVKENDIKQTKNIKSLKSLSNYQKSSILKSSLFSKTNSKTKSSYRPKTTRTYYRGSRGGCYYINLNGNKTYVARSLCN